MTVKPDAKTLLIKEQIIEDCVTGLTFQFVVTEAVDAPFRFRIYGTELGTREFLFDIEGGEGGSGTALGDTCPASWLSVIPSVGMSND